MKEGVFDGIALLPLPLLLVSGYPRLYTRMSAALNAKSLLHITCSDTTLYGNLIGQNTTFYSAKLYNKRCHTTFQAIKNGYWKWAGDETSFITPFS